MSNRETMTSEQDSIMLQEQLLHRWEVQQLISQGFERAGAVPEIAIVGMGNWDDINWVEAAAHASRLVCMDLGNTGSQAAVKGITTPLAQKIEVRSMVDAAGLTETKVFEELQTLLDDKAPAERVVSYIQAKSAGLEKADKLKEHHGQFDFAVSNAVHSQLFYIDAMLTLAPSLEQYDKNGTESIIGASQAMRLRVVEAYTNELLSLLKPGGIVLVWTDVVRLNDHTRKILEELYMVRSEKERVRTMFQAFGRFGDEAAVAGLN